MTWTMINTGILYSYFYVAKLYEIICFHDTATKKINDQ